MSVHFFDASAIVKRYVREPGSVWVRGVCEARDGNGNRVNRVAIAEIGRVEVAAAFAVLVRRNEISKSLGKHAYEQFIGEAAEEYRSIRLTPATVHNAAELTQRHPLKAYDAVQLASALAFQESLQASGVGLTFVSGDDNLLQAAHAEGLTTENPFEHSDLDAVN
jgi:predicted nucleic acid-binding protein